MKNEIAKKINAYLANIAVSYVKAHNLHWNVVGGAFKPTHEYLESMYDGFGEELDAVAEILKMHDQMPLASMKDYLAVATVKELDSKEVSIPEALKIALDDVLLLKSQAEDIRKAADSEDLYDVVAHMEDSLSGYNKTIWFVRSMLK